MTFERLCVAIICIWCVPRSYAQATIRVPADQPSIQAGIAAAKPGDTVLVSPGIYLENIDFLGKAITVTSTDGAAKTIIDGGNKLGSPTVQFINGESRSSIISSFTIRNGGNAYVGVTSSPSGGVYAYHSAPTITGNTITNNQCDGVLNDSAAALVEGNTISGTVGNTFGECVLDGGAAVMIFETTMDFGPEVVPSVIGNIIENNIVAGTGLTGGIELWLADGTLIAGNTIRNNTGANGGAIVSQNTRAVAIVQNLMYGNTGFHAGAIWFESPGYNVGPLVGILANNTIADNNNPSTQALPGELPASQIYLGGSTAQYALVNNIIVGVTTGMAAVNCQAVLAEGIPLSFDHNDVYARKGVSFGGGCSDPTGTYGNISVDPQFAASSTGNYTLRSGSPGLDTGNNSAPVVEASDIAGSPRIQDATGKGYAVIDLGAFEAAGKQEQAPTTLSLSPSEYFSSITDVETSPLTFTATLASPAGVPTGPVEVLVDGSPVMTVQIGSTGITTFSISGVFPGLHAFEATYAGGSGYAPAESVVFYLIIPETQTSLNLTSSANPAFVDSPVTFTVAASAIDKSIPSPIALVNLATNTPLATLIPNSSGIASFTTSALPVGDFTIQASYAGTSIYGPAQTTLVQQILNGSASATSLSCLPTSIAVGGSAALSAAVSSLAGTPLGSVAFSDNGTPFAQVPLVNGAATETYTGQASGSHTLTATFVPSAAFNRSSASCIETVNALPSVSTLTVGGATPPIATTPVTLTVAVSPATKSGLGVPIGTVSFFNSGSPIGTSALANGIATLTSSLAAGNATLTCSYSGDAVYAASNCSAVSETVRPAPSSLTIASSSNPSIATSPVTFTVNLSTSAVASQAGEPLSLAIGDRSPIALTTDPNGTAVFTATSLVPGNYSVTAAFAGTANVAGTSAALTQVVNAAPTTTTLTASPGTTLVGQSVTLIVSVLSGGAPVGTGTVSLFDGTSLIGTLGLGGGTPLAFTTAPLSLGSHFFTAQFAAGGNYLGSVSLPVVEIVTNLPTSATLLATPTTVYAGQHVTLAVGVSAAGAQIPQGTVTLLDGSSTIGTAVLDRTGHATVVLDSLSVGTHSLTASFAAGGVFGSSVSAPVQETILLSGFAVTLSPSTITIRQGQQGATTLTVNSAGLYAGSVDLTYGTLPTNGSVTINPATVGLAVGGSASAAVSFGTSMRGPEMHSERQLPGAPGRRQLPIALAGLACLLWRLRLQRRLRNLLAIVLLAAALQVITGCTDIFYDLDLVAPGTYQVPFTGTDGNGVTQSATLTLVVTK